MAKANYWENDDGLVIGFGTRDVEGKRGGNVRTSGEKEQLVVEFSYDDLPEGGNLVDADGSYVRIPENSLILDAYFEVLEAFADGTSYDIGLDEPDGTAIDADGLWDSLDLSDINSVGDRSVASDHGGTNSGTLCNSAISEPGVLVVTESGSFTSGRARVVIEYIN